MGLIETDMTAMLTSLVSNRKQQANYAIEQFEFKECLGEGCSGKVYKVHIKDDYRQAPYALKVLNENTFIDSKQKEHLKSEMQILNLVNHPFIIKLINNFERSKRHYMLFEYISGGDLHDKLIQNRRLSLENTKFYLAQVLVALQYLHRNEIVFRDLKPENILIDKYGYIKLADFGFSKFLKDNSKTYTLCGTPEYLSPEFLTKNGEGYGKSIDWWAFGVLLYEMLVGETPFLANTPTGIYKRIIKGEIVFPKFIDSTSKDIILKFLNPNVNQRLGCQKNNKNVQAHPFFENICFQDLLKKSIKPPKNESTICSYSSFTTDCSTNSDTIEIKYSELEVKFGIFDCVCL